MQPIPQSNTRQNKRARKLHTSRPRHLERSRVNSQGSTGWSPQHILRWKKTTPPLSILKKTPKLWIYYFLSAYISCTHMSTLPIYENWLVKKYPFYFFNRLTLQCRLWIGIPFSSAGSWFWLWWRFKIIYYLITYVNGGGGRDLKPWIFWVGGGWVEERRSTDVFR